MGLLFAESLSMENLIEPKRGYSEACMTINPLGFNEKLHGQQTMPDFSPAWVQLMFPQQMPFKTPLSAICLTFKLPDNLFSIFLLE